MGTAVSGRDVVGTLRQNLLGLPGLCLVRAGDGGEAGTSLGLGAGHWGCASWAWFLLQGTAPASWGQLGDRVPKTKFCANKAGLTRATQAVRLTPEMKNSDFLFCPSCRGVRGAAPGPGARTQRGSLLSQPGSEPFSRLCRVLGRARGWGSAPCPQAVLYPLGSGFILWGRASLPPLPLLVLPLCSPLPFLSAPRQSAAGGVAPGGARVTRGGLWGLPVPAGLGAAASGPPPGARCPSGGVSWRHPPQTRLGGAPEGGVGAGRCSVPPPRRVLPVPAPSLPRRPGPAAARR